MNAYPKTYFKNLDALRFFAFLLIFSGHVIFSHGERASSLYSFFNQHVIAGIDIYTALSGFLITWIILEEYQYTSRFSLGYFWLKRCLRIWPLYFLIVLIGIVLIWVSRNILGKPVANIPPLSWLLTFTLNFYIAKHGDNFLYIIAFLWSISVEEQCYATWGILLKWGRKVFIPFCILLLIISLLFRVFNVHDSLTMYFNSLSWIGVFTSGGLLAYGCINRNRVLEKLKKMPLWSITFVYGLFIINFAFYKQLYASDFMTVLERLSASLFFCFIIWEQSFCEKHLFELGKIPFFNYLGRISYGLFCYHGLVILIYEQLTQHISWINNPVAVFIINPVVIFAFTLGISALSYQYLEKPIMSLRYKYQTA